MRRLSDHTCIEARYHLQRDCDAENYFHEKQANKDVVTVKEALKWALTKPLEESLVRFSHVGKSFRGNVIKYDYLLHLGVTLIAVLIYMRVNL
jgi:hypothetical protein